ncbi:hypothetical protein [Novosphingobium sp. KN65.2]|uniref:hypothetical protein n=1 Tax=Novosphingobium sp. KN65.2 TaxID=1478134 RepID=UPI0005DF0136|nr:hypothetical protein [Novosphingobium sp. KN65.2]CDO34434.1 hypothetical protein SPHV1_1570007 [Novosphingobium sp. KN65.2]
MRYRISGKKGSYTLTVEDGEDMILSVPSATLTEAKALQRRAVLEGVSALEAARPAATPPKKRSTAK